MTNSYFIQENCHTEKNPSTSYKSPKRRTLGEIIDNNLCCAISIYEMARNFYDGRTILSTKEKSLFSNSGNWFLK